MNGFRPATSESSYSQENLSSLALALYLNTLGYDPEKSLIHLFKCWGYYVHTQLLKELSMIQQI